MIRIAQVNMTAMGSTGNIMLKTVRLANRCGMDARSFSTIRYTKPPEEKQNYNYHKYYGSFFENKIHTILGKITGLNGCFSFMGTFQLIKTFKKFRPDIIHLHNLHHFCINLPMLFRYIKKNNIRVIWTLHDCWTFTGHCPHFIIAQCDKWKKGCYCCPQYKKYPKTYVDRSKQMYLLKKKWFCHVNNMTIVTPSEWLAGLVRQSYLKDYPVRVINNGIDRTVFKPTKSNFREKYGCKNKKIILGVSFGWGYSKGLDVFLELAERLDETYKIVLVGTNVVLDDKLPKNIISIHRTNNQQELAEIYSAADLFVNPTREETFPTVNMEALACGTPVITFQTGGSPEIINETCGTVVKYNDIDEMECEIMRICQESPYTEQACVNRAEHFDMHERFEEYVTLYERIMST